MEIQLKLEGSKLEVVLLKDGKEISNDYVWIDDLVDERIRDYCDRNICSSFN